MVSPSRDSSLDYSYLQVKTREALNEPPHLNKGQEEKLLIVMKALRELNSPFRDYKEAFKNNPFLKEVKLYPSYHPVFELPNTIPGVIFKMTKEPNRMITFEKRLESTARCRETVERYHLNRLLIPQSLIIKDVAGSGFSIYAERKLDLEEEPEDPKRYFDDRSNLKDQQDAVKQLAIFISKAGYTDAQWGNNPPLKGETAFGLIDLEPLSFDGMGPSAGIEGFKGLSSLVSKVYKDTIQQAVLNYMDPDESSYINFANFK